MPRVNKKKVQTCQDHQFSLIPLRSDVYYKQTASLSYCKGQPEPKTRKQHTKPEHQQNCGCFPVYNQDKNFVTGSFILPEERKHFVENSEKLKFEHEQRLYEYNDQKSKMLIPKPKSKYSYCSTCKTNYEDYLQHVQSQSHKNFIKRSRITQYMKDLQRKYEGTNRKIQPCQNSKNFDGPSTSNFNDINIEQISRPQKRIKTQINKKQIQQGIVTGTFPINTINTHSQSQNVYYSYPYPYEFYHGYGGFQPVGYGNGVFLGGFGAGLFQMGNGFNMGINGLGINTGINGMGMNTMPNMTSMNINPIPNMPNMGFITPMNNNVGMPNMSSLAHIQNIRNNSYMCMNSFNPYQQNYNGITSCKPVLIDLESVQHQN